MNTHTDTKIQLNHNLSTAAIFVGLLCDVSPEEAWDTPMQFQIFSDDKSLSATWKRRGNKTPIDPLARVLYGTLKNLHTLLVRANNEGAGIFVTVNECVGDKRSNGQVSRIRAIFIDGDSDKFTGNLKLKPSFVVRRGRNFHAYWRVKDMPLEEFSPTQLGVAMEHTTDHITDLSRVLRLPGFFHQKSYHSQGYPEMCRLDVDEDVPDYTAAEIHEAYPMYIKPPRVIERPSASDMPRQRHHPVGSDNLTVGELIERAKNAKNGMKFTLLFNGDISGYSSYSEAELALYNLCLFWGGLENSEDMFQSSALFRDKWFEKRGQLTYGEMTRHKSISGWDGNQFVLHSEPRLGATPLSTLEVYKRYDQNRSIITLRGLGRINDLSVHSSTRESYAKVWMLIVNRFANPENFHRNEKGEVIVTLGGLQKAQLNGVGGMYQVSLRIRSMQPYGFHNGIEHLRPENVKSELCIVIPENFEQLGIFTTPPNNTNQDEDSRPLLPTATQARTMYLQSNTIELLSLPVKEKAYCFPSSKARLERESYPLRRASTVAGLLNLSGSKTLEELKAVSPHGVKGLTIVLDALVTSGSVKFDGERFSIDWDAYRTAKTEEAESSVGYRNAAILMARQSISQYAMVAHFINGKRSHTIQDIKKLEEARKKEAFHRERLERLNDGEPVWMVFDLYSDLPAQRQQERLARAA